LYNTPPTYSIYVANLIFEWILKNGGIQEIEKKNKEKSNLLYDFIDNSNLFL
jgi:phosphoserine aminotransferase